MKTIDIAINENVATVITEDAAIVCGNSDYILNFSFSEEWSGAKTARFVYDSNIVDVEFTGNSCNVPTITGSREVYVGLFAEGIASTAVRINCLYSALCEDITGIDPEPIVIPDVEGYKAEIAELKESNEALKASIKPEQEKAVTITENGTTEILPDDGKALSKVIVNVDVPSNDEQYEMLKNTMSNLKFDTASGGVIRLDCSKFARLTSLEKTFQSISSVATIYLSNTQNIKNWAYCFYTVNNLNHIYGDLDMSSATNVNSAFQATRIKTISFVPETIKIAITFNSGSLSNESIQSIIDGLATVETAQKLTLHTDIILKLTENQLDTIANKNWLVG